MQADIRSDQLLVVLGFADARSTNEGGLVTYSDCVDPNVVREGQDVFSSWVPRRAKTTVSCSIDKVPTVKAVRQYYIQCHSNCESQWAYTYVLHLIRSYKNGTPSTTWFLMLLLLNPYRLLSTCWSRLICLLSIFGEVSMISLCTVHTFGKHAHPDVLY